MSRTHAQTLRERSEHEYDRYTAYENLRWKRLMTDELTGASERLKAPMSNVFEYTLASDGELYFNQQAIGPILDKSIMVAEQICRSQPDFYTELIRRRLERQEYDDERILALGKEDDPNVLLVISPIPDAVVVGRVVLDQYDTERQKTMLRLYERTERGIRATSLSLDLSDRDGLNALAQKFNQEIPKNASSEDILAMRFVGYKNDFEDTPSVCLRKTYDEVLRLKYGGEWYGGRQDAPVLDALAFITLQTDIIEQHQTRLRPLMDLMNGSVKERLLEQERQNFAAALHERMRGKQGAISNARAGAAAAARGEVFSGDCPTSVKSAEESLLRLGIGDKMLCVTCPFCNTIVDAARSKEGGWRCLRKECGATTNHKNERIDQPKKNLPPKKQPRTSHRGGFLENLQAVVEELVGAKDVSKNYNNKISK
jgi:hypothetical protein